MTSPLPGAFPLSPKQIAAIVESRHHRISILTGAVRSGKTISCLVAFLLALAEAPRSGVVAVVGKTLQSIERNLFDPLQDEALFGAVARDVHHTRGANVATIMGRTVHLIGANDARAEGRLRGMTACLMLVDEATLIPHEFWTQALARLSMPGARMIASSNPENPSHWLRKDFILRANELGVGHWHFTLDDNPSLTPEYVAALKREMTGVFYKRYIDGLWVAAEGAIFDMFDEDRHVVPFAQVPLIDRWLAVGIDYGTTAPFAAVLLGMGVDQRLYVVSEWRYDSRHHHRAMTDAEYSAAVQNWLANVELPGAGRRDEYGQVIPIKGVQPELICVDPSAASFIVTLNQDGLLPTRARNSVIDGIRNVATLFARDRLRIVDTCRGLLDELPGYAWSDEKAEKGIDEPIKADDHSIDSLRYGVHTTESLWRPYLMDVA